MLRIGVCLLLAVLPSATAQWMTEYDEHFKIECAEDNTIKALSSHHDNDKEDRVWNMVCAPAPGEATLTECEWTGYVNDYDALLEYQCPAEKILCGIEAIHDNSKEDRKFGFKCCNPVESIAHGCEFTPYVNQYDGEMNYRVPDGYVIKGVNSVHDNKHEDRIFRFDICKLDPGSVVG